MTLAEILAALNGLEDADAAVDALRADNGAVVKAFRSKVFAQGKKEGTKDLKAVEDPITRTCKFLGGAAALALMVSATHAAAKLKTAPNDLIGRARRTRISRPASNPASD